jgi:hypothetical protein
MKAIAMVAAVGLVIGACAADSELAPKCADISGNYHGNSVRLSGTCDPKLDGDGQTTFTLTKGAGGTMNISVPSIPGACPGTFDAAACRFQATCEGRGADGVSTVATFAVDYTFTAGNSFKGSNVAGLRPPAVKDACTASYEESGTRL